MRCPSCKSHVVQIMAAGINMKQQTSLNLNPLKPFTIFNHKQKKKKSATKVGAALLTGGMSTLATGGTGKNKQFEVFCMDCGNRWQSK